MLIESGDLPMIINKTTRRKKMKKNLIKLFLLGLTFLLLAGVTGCKNNNQNEDIKKIDSIIESFVANYLNDYFNAENANYLDYNVVIAVKKLEEQGYNIKLEDFISKTTVQTYYENFESNQTVSNIYKASMILKAFSLETLKYKNELLAIKMINSEWEYGQLLMLYDLYEIENELKAEILANITVVKEESFVDADYAGFALMALKGYQIDLTSLYDLIIPNISDKGVVSWGEANSSTTAQVLTGLVYQNEDIKNEKYLANEISLFEALIKFEDKGGFKWQLNDENVDLMFSTPQAILALVSYREYLLTK